MIKKMREFVNEKALRIALFFTEFVSLVAFMFIMFVMLTTGITVAEVLPSKMTLLLITGVILTFLHCIICILYKSDDIELFID